MRRQRNSYPFLALFIIHTILLLLTFQKKKKDRKPLLILLLSNIGFAYLFEYFVLNIFGAYRYKPGILKQRYLDNIFGAILSQAIFVPFTALFITAFKLGWKVKIGFALYFACIERIFLKINVYKNHWWKTFYTAFLIPCYFWVSDKWYKLIIEKVPSVLFISLFNSIMVTGANLLYILAIIKRFKFGTGIYHSWREHFIIAPLYSIALSLFSAWSIRKNGWMAKVRILLFASGLDCFITKIGFVRPKFHDIVQNSMIHALMIYISTLYKDLIYGRKRTTPGT